MKTNLNWQLVCALACILLHSAMSPPELGAQNENAPPPQRRGAVRRGAVPVDPNAKPVLTGRVVDNRGEPITDAQLTFIASNPALDQGGRAAFTARTDANGNYALVGVTQVGEYRVQIRSQMAVGLTSGNLERVHLSLETPTTRDFVLPRACQIRVQVVNELLEPIPQARMYMGPVGERRPGISSVLIRTDAQGFATLGGVAPSDVDYIIAAMVDGYATGKLVTKLHDVEKPATGLIMLTKGEDVKGTAICSDGKPAAGWRVVALPDWWTFSTSPIGVEIDADGVFTLKNISAADKYSLSISIPAGDNSSRRRPMLESTALLPRNEPLVLKIPEPSPGTMSVIAGTVRLIGAPLLGGIGVEAQPVDDISSTLLSSSVRDGKFRIGPIPPGRYSVVFNSREIEHKVIRDVVAPIENLEVELVVIGKLMLRGVAVNAETGQPLQQFRVRIAKLEVLRENYNSPQDIWRDFENADGQFEIELTGPGVYQAIVAADGVAWTRSEKINTDEYKGAPIRFAMSSGATLNGTVVDDRGQPIDGATVTPASRSTGAMPREYQQFKYSEGGVKTAAGRFTLEHLEPGQEKLKVTHPDYTHTISESIDVPSAGATASPIKLRAGGAIQGRVFDTEGRPKSGVSLIVREGQGSSFPGDISGLLGTAVTNAQGEYEIQHLPLEICYISRQSNFRESQLGVTSISVKPQSGKTLTVDLGGETPIAGRMLVNGVPAANVQLQLGDSNPSWGSYYAVAQTDAAGNFIFWSPPPGKRFLYYSTGTRHSEWLQVREVQVTGEPLDLGDVSFRPAKLSVRIEPLPNPAAGRLGVDLIRYSGSSPAGTVIAPSRPSTAADAAYEFAELAPGRYKFGADVLVRGSNSQLKSLFGIHADIEVTNEPAQVMSFTWPQGTAIVRGRVVGDLDTKASSPSYIVSKDRRIVSWCALAPDKTFEISGLPSGEYYIAQSESALSPKLIEFSLADGETKSIEITTEEIRRQTPDYAMIQLHTYATSGLPLSGCKIEFAGGGKPPVAVNSSDAYAFFMADAGEYEMTVSCPGFESVRRKVAFIPASKKPSLDQYQIDVFLKQMKK